MVFVFYYITRFRFYIKRLLIILCYYVSCFGYNSWKWYVKDSLYELERSIKWWRINLWWYIFHSLNLSILRWDWFLVTLGYQKISVSFRADWSYWNVCHTRTLIEVTDFLQLGERVDAPRWGEAVILYLYCACC